MAQRPYRRPSRRPLRIFALDPMRVDRGKAGMVIPRTTIYVPYEKLRPGPIGARIEVIDYDGVHDCFYEPVDLDDPYVLIRDGLAPSEIDPRFHQQMVYGVVASVWAAFETALGRRVGLGANAVLRLYPHAFYGENAYYDHEHGALMFGYFKASDDDPGENLPGQMVYTCLSHDVIVHETTHALVDRLRPHFTLDSNPDVLAFHEGFSDLVAIFQHFTMREVLESAIADSSGALGATDYLLSLARQFGYATGMGAALRDAEPSTADVAAYRQSNEPHQRGAVLVRAIFDAFLAMYSRETQDLFRLATSGTGVLPAGALHPDLVARLADEAGRIAQQFFTGCLRAFDYLPPLDVTFEDFLRAIVTADIALSPSDDTFRVAIIEGCRRYGIFPASVGSLGGDAVAFEQLEKPIRGFPIEDRVMLDILRDLDDPDYKGYQQSEGATVHGAPVAWTRWEERLAEFGMKNRRKLGLDTRYGLIVESMHPTIRYRANGRPTADLVVRYLQERPDLDEEKLGPTPLAGATVIGTLVPAIPADARGDEPTGLVLHIIPKPLPPSTTSGADVPGAARWRVWLNRLQSLENDDPARFAYRTIAARDRLRVNFALLHSSSDRRQT
jgi:hypothetical protein